MSVLQVKKDVKVSHYTHVFSYPDGLRLAYNTLTGNLITLKDEEGDIIETILKQGDDSFVMDMPEREMLINMGFLVDEDINELNVVSEIFRIGRRSQGLATLTILPTLGCNFECPYCFERHTKGLMDKRTQDALVKFVEINLLPKSNGLAIEWFGGEPLLGFSVIKSLTQKFQELCRRRGLKHPTASLTTNGYLLTSKMADQLLALGIESAQVTIDGPPEVHNRRRPLVGGKGSFTKILENLKTAPKDLKMSIRINVDAGNKDSVFELLKILFREGVISKASPYIAMAESFSERCRSSEGAFLTSEQFAQFKIELRRRCLEAGIPWFSNEQPRLAAAGFCIVDTPKGFVVQPDGKLLQCWAESGNDTGTAVAHLLREETWNRVVLSVLQNRDPFEYEECCECKLLPVCMGGCPRIRRNLQKENIKCCPPLRYLLSDEVHVLYSSQISSTEQDKATLQQA